MLLENHINSQGLAAIEKLGDEALNVRCVLFGEGLFYAKQHDSIKCFYLRRGVYYAKYVARFKMLARSSLFFVWGWVVLRETARFDKTFMFCIMRNIKMFALR